MSEGSSGSPVDESRPSTSSSLRSASSLLKPRPSTSSAPFAPSGTLKSIASSYSTCSKASRVSFGTQQHQCAIKITTPEEGKAVKPGDNISGVVYFRIMQDCEASAMQISIAGAEDSRVTYRNNVKDGRREKKVLRRTQNGDNFLFSHWNIKEFPDNKCPAGQYEFPFCYTLPMPNPRSSDNFPFLLATFQQQKPKDICEEGAISTNHGACEIGYYVEARLFSDGWFEADTTARASFLVELPLPTKLPAPESLEVEAAESLWLWRCIEQGTMNIKASVSNTCFINGTDCSPVEVFYQAENKSKVVVTSVVVELVERVWWHAKNIKKSHKMWKAFAEITETLRIPADKLNVGKKCMGPDEGPVLITTPSHFRADFSGELIGCEHYVRVTLEADDKRPRPIVKLPFTLYDCNVAARGLPPPLDQEEEVEDIYHSEDDGTNTWTPAISNGLEKTLGGFEWKAHVADEVFLENDGSKSLGIVGLRCRPAATKEVRDVVIKGSSMEVQSEGIDSAQSTWKTKFDMMEKLGLGDNMMPVQPRGDFATLSGNQAEFFYEADMNGPKVEVRMIQEDTSR